VDILHPQALPSQYLLYLVDQMTQNHSDLLIVPPYHLAALVADRLSADHFFLIFLDQIAVDHHPAFDLVFAFLKLFQLAAYCILHRR